MAFCNKCGSYGNCGCHTSFYQSYSQPCNNCEQPDANGCLSQIDAPCVIYGKSNNQVSGLTNLGLPNGSTLKLVLDTIDNRLQGTNVSAWTLAFLRAVPHTINNLQQFGQAVDIELGELAEDLADVAASAASPIIPADSSTIDIGVSGLNDHTITASLKLSVTANNRASILSDGLFVAAQTLSADYDAKTISIAGGNTINMLNFCGCEDCNSFAGNVSTDPTTPVAGQYWYNTSANELRIFLNGTKHKIALTAV